MKAEQAVVTTEPDMTLPVTSDLDETGNHAMQVHAANESVSPMAAMLSLGSHDPEAISKLWDIQKDWEERESRKAYYAAKAAASVEIPLIGRNKKNAHLRSEYADLDSMIAAVGPVAGRHGLSVEFDYDQTTTPGFVIVTCICTHGSGHSGKTTATMPIMAPIRGAKGPATNDCQMVGVAMTYGRRYSFAAMFSIATVDDDGGPAPQPQQAPEPATIDDKRFDENWPKWVKLVESKEKTAVTIITQVSRKYSLSEVQMGKLTTLTEYESKGGK